MDHFKVLKRAWQISWKYRALWLVGLLLVLAGGGLGSGFSGSPPSGSSGGSGGSGPGGGPYGGPGGFRSLPELWAMVVPVLIAIAALIFILLLLAIVFGIVATFVRYVTRTALIHMVQGYEETGEEIGFKRGMRLGWSRAAFRLFLMNWMVGLPLVLLMMLLIMPLVGFSVWSFAAAGGPRIVLGILLILLVIPVSLLGIALAIVVGPILEIAYRRCVLEDLGPWEAFKEAWALIRRHLGPAALQWLLLVGLRIAWGIVLIPINLLLVFVALFVSGLPALLVGGLASAVASWPWGLGLGLLVFVPTFIVVVAVPNIVLGIFATVYHSTVWTLTYRELMALDTVLPVVDAETAES
jgi:hypothetical protein